MASRDKNVIWTITVNHRNPNGKRKYLQINAGKRQLRQLRRSKTLKVLQLHQSEIHDSAFILIHMRPVSKAKPRYFLPEHSKLVSGKHIGCMTSSAQWKWSFPRITETARHPCLSESNNFFTLKIIWQATVPMMSSLVKDTLGNEMYTMYAVNAVCKIQIYNII